MGFPWGLGDEIASVKTPCRYLMFVGCLLHNSIHTYAGCLTDEKGLRKMSNNCMQVGNTFF